MVSRWYSSISGFDDILRFRDHIWAINEDAGERRIPLCEREFPGSLYVHGNAYPVIKEKVLLVKRRQRGVIIGAISGLFGGPASVASNVAQQTFGYIWEGWEDRKNEVRKAASIITSSYYGISDDTEYSMNISYVFDSDNTWEYPPTLY